MGYFIFLALLKRYFLFYPKFSSKEILDKAELKKFFEEEGKDFRGANDAEHLNKLLQDADAYKKIEQKEKGSELFKKIQSKASRLPKKYFSAACIRLYLDEKISNGLMSMQEKSRMLIDHLAIYVVLGTVAGARLGHFLFYEQPSRYIKDPLSILRVWEGGLASHGAIIGIIIALFLFHFWSKKRAPDLTFVAILDLLCIPTALAGGFIRLGNFFNQEISGTVTDVPWAVIFGHPFDRSLPAPRHPVQVYESLFYVCMFVVLWFLSKRKAFFLKRGRLIGLFFVLVFSFRFFIEFFKEEQSSLMIQNSTLTMGQMLSIPAVLLGLIFFFLPLFSSKNQNA